MKSDKPAGTGSSHFNRARESVHPSPVEISEPSGPTMTPFSPGTGPVFDPHGNDDLVLTPLSEIEAREIIYVDKPLLQASAYHQFVGRKGAGKGTTLANIAARLTRGELGSKRNAIWFASEDSNAIDVRPRVEAAGGELERVHVVTHGWLQLPGHIGLMKEKALDIGDVGLVIIDPISNHIGTADSNADTQVRAAIAPLNDLADDLACMVFGIRHLSEKEIAGKTVLGAILGASAWVQVPRVVLALVRDDDDPDLAHFQCVAGNRMPPDAPGRLVRIEGHLLPGFQNEVTRAVWLGDSTKDVETLLSAPRKKSATKTDAAREILLDLLEAAPDKRMESDELDARVANATGLSAGTVRNLRTDLKNDGLIRMKPERNEDDETFKRWLVIRTNATRNITFEPEHVSKSEAGSGPVNEPAHPTQKRGELAHFTSELGNPESQFMSGVSGMNGGPDSLFAENDEPSPEEVERLADVARETLGLDRDWDIPF
jgi:hypothetical protein